MPIVADTVKGPPWDPIPILQQIGFKFWVRYLSPQPAPGSFCQRDPFKLLEHALPACKESQKCLGVYILLEQLDGYGV